MDLLLLPDGIISLDGAETYISSFSLGFVMRMGVTIKIDEETVALFW